MGRTTRQKALALETLAEIEEHPEAWNQETWRCASGMCYAGHAGVLSGARWVLKNDPYSPLVRAGKFKTDGETFLGITEDNREVQVLSVRRWAQLSLGLSDSESSQFFDGKNTLEELQEMVMQFVTDRPIHNARLYPLPAMTLVEQIVLDGPVHCC